MKNYARKIKKDYQIKNLRNPFFNSKTSGKRLWFIPLAAGFVLFMLWFFLDSDFWKISEIKQEGFSRIPQSAVEEVILSEASKSRGIFFSASNIFLFEAESACRVLLENYSLTSCSIEKNLPKTLIVQGQERPYAFIWQEGSELFYASQDGYISRDRAVSEEDKGKYFTLENKNPASLIGQNNLINVKSDYLSFALFLSEKIQAEESLKLDRLIIDWEFNTLKAKFVAGPVVLFNTKDDAVKQLNRLLLVKNQKIKDNFSKTNYIDLRYGDKIFINPEFN